MMAASRSTGRLLVGAWTGIVMLMAGQVVDTILAVLKAVMLAGVITATPTQTTDITIWRR
jgi:hypothetical protein